MVLGVEDVVRDARFAQELGQLLALFDRHRADQHRLALLVADADLLDDGAQLAGLVFIHDVGVVDADDGLVRRDLDDVEVIDGRKLLFLGHGRAGHAGEFAVETEVVLERDGREGLVLALHAHVLLGLDGLVQTVAVAAAEHEAAGELIDDDDLAVLDNVVNVALHDAVGADGLIDVVHERGVFDIREVFEAEGRLGLGDAAGGERRGAGLFVDNVVGVEVLVLLFLIVDGGVGLARQAGGKILRLTVKVGALIALAGDDERGARLIDEDGVHLVDDGEGVAALHHLGLIDGHVVTQVVKAHLVVRAVGDVGRVGLLALGARHVVHDQADAQAEEAVDLAHPLAVAAGEVIVDGDDVHALAGERVEVRRQDGDEGLAFAGLHLGDAALMQHDAADELHAKRLHAQHAPRGLARRGKRLRQQVVERLAVGVALLELVGLGAQLLVRERGIFVRHGFNFISDRIEPLELMVAVRTKYFFEKTHLLTLLVQCNLGLYHTFMNKKRANQPRNKFLPDWAFSHCRNGSNAVEYVFV